MVQSTVLAGVPFGRSNYFGVAGCSPEIPGVNATPPAANNPVMGNIGNGAGIGVYVIVPAPGAPYSTLLPSNIFVHPNYYRGTFGANSKRGFRDMTDGTSNIVVVGERYTPLNGRSGTEGVVGDGAWAGIQGFQAALATPNTGAGSVPTTGGKIGEAATLGECTFSINHNFTSAYPRPQTTGFGSMHTGGAHFLMADGAVRFISQNVDLTTYRNLSTINDGAVIGDF